MISSIGIYELVRSYTALVIVLRLIMTYHFHNGLRFDLLGSRRVPQRVDRFA